MQCPSKEHINTTTFLWHDQTRFLIFAGSPNPISGHTGSPNSGLTKTTTFFLTRFLTFTGSPNFGVEDDEIGPQFAGPLSLEEGHEAAEVLQVEGVVSPRRLVPVADHGAEEPLVTRRWGADEPPQLEGVRDVALDKE